MPTICPECGGEMKFYPPYYSCLSCGLSAKRSELDDLREKYRDLVREENEKEYEDEKGRKAKLKRKRQKEMLDWYTSSKK